MDAPLPLPPPPPVRLTGSPLVRTGAVGLAGPSPLPCFRTLSPPPGPRDDVGIEIAAPRIDSAGRIQLTDLLRRMSVTAGLSGRVTHGALVLEADPDEPGSIVCPVDSAGRLRLAAAVQTRLGIERGGRVLVIAVPDLGRIVVQSATAARASLPQGLVA